MPRVTWKQLCDLPLVGSWSDRSFKLARRQYGTDDPRALTRLEVVDNLSTAFGLARVEGTQWRATAKDGSAGRRAET